jgi:hypothetical protein
VQVPTGEEVGALQVSDLTFGCLRKEAKEKKKKKKRGQER